MLRRTISRAGTVDAFNFGQPSLKQAFATGRGMRIQNNPGAAAGGSLRDNGIERTELPNGIKVVTHNREGVSAAAGFYIDAGAKYDPIGAPGLSYVMRWALLTSNMENSLFQIDRTARATGAAYSHSEVRKRAIGIKGESRSDMWKPLFNQLSSAIAVPRFADSDLERFRDTWDNMLEEQRWQHPREYVVEQLEQVAFYKEPLGNPRHVRPESNDDLVHEKLLEQFCACFRPQNITLAGVNIAADELMAEYLASEYQVSADAPHFRDSRVLRLDTNDSERVQFYAGKEKHEYEKRAAVMGTKPDMDKEVITAIGYITNGRDANTKAYATSAVVREILSMAFNDGIRYNRYETDAGTRAFYKPYSSAGLIGATVRGDPANAQAVTRDTISLVANLAKEAPKKSTLDAAISRAELTLYNEELELTRDYLDFVATSKQTAAELADAFKSVTADDVKREFAAMTGPMPSMFATGDLNGFPTLRDLGARGSQ